MFELPRSVMRNVPLFFAAAPRTPLRVLSLISLDTLHRLRTGRSMSRRRVLDLAMFVDFQGCANAAFDRKRLCQSRYQAIRQTLEERGFGGRASTYLHELETLETRKPPIGGNDGNFERVAAYREAVARLDVTTLVAIAFDGTAGAKAPAYADQVEVRTYAGRPFRAGEADVEALVRILLQCQIIDDVIDYEKDLAAGLPSFLTACVPLPRALELTTAAARSHGPRCSASARIPFRVAHWLFTVAARLVVWRSSRRSYALRPTPYALRAPVAHKTR
jgi:hypothetical protein